jgi:hypothetical protein
VVGRRAPSKLQGVRFNSVGDAVSHLESRRRQRGDAGDSIQTINALNRLEIKPCTIRKLKPDCAIRWRSRCRRASPSCSTCTEPAHVGDLRREAGRRLFAANRLLARRLAERGVRFIQLYHRDWDHHNNIKNDIVFKAQEVDWPTAGSSTI